VAASTATGDAAFEGHGRIATGGLGGDLYRVTSLANSGPGTLRDAVENRSSPRTVVFDVAGTIVLEGDLVVRRPYLTIDGSTAPPPGITIRQSAMTDNFIIAGTHDVVITHLRFHGVWERGGRHSQNAATFLVDGDTRPDRVAQRIVLDHVTGRGAVDGGPDIWGEVRDVTVSWCLFFYNWHPTTVSHNPAPFQVRQRISMHHNVYARNGERNPQLRADVRDLDYVNNVVYDWGYFGEGSGYGMRIRSEPDEPSVNANIVANAFVPTSRRAAWALVYGASPGPDRDDGGPAGGAVPQGTVVGGTRMGRLWVAGNLLPLANLDHYSTLPEPLPVPAEFQVTTWPAAELGSRVLPGVGMKYRDEEEQALLDELRAALERVYSSR
jgi:pectate lyase